MGAQQPKKGAADLRGAISALCQSIGCYQTRSQTEKDRVVVRIKLLQLNLPSKLLTVNLNTTVVIRSCPMLISPRYTGTPGMWRFVYVYN